MAAGLEEAARLSSHVVDVAVKTARSGQGVELEGRLGVFECGAFCTDVGREHFLSAVRVLESFDSWSEDSKWVEMEDVFFYGVRSKAEIRSRVVFHEAAVVHGPVNVQKRRLALRDVHVGGGFSARICASVEDPACPYDTPRVVVPHRVSLSRRRSFTLAGGEFRIDCSEVWAAKSRSEAVSRRSGGLTPCCAIEVEVLKPIDYLTSRGDCGCDVLALSILSKLADFVQLERYEVAAPSAK
jgi:hypothetical protein